MERARNVTTHTCNQLVRRHVPGLVAGLDTGPAFPFRYSSGTLGTLGLPFRGPLTPALAPPDTARMRAISLIRSFSFSRSPLVPVSLLIPRLMPSKLNGPLTSVAEWGATGFCIDVIGPPSEMEGPGPDEVEDVCVASGGNGELSESENVASSRDSSSSERNEPPPLLKFGIAGADVGCEIGQ